MLQGVTVHFLAHKSPMAPRGGQNVRRHTVRSYTHTQAASLVVKAVTQHAARQAAGKTFFFFLLACRDAPRAKTLSFHSLITAPSSPCSTTWLAIRQRSRLLFKQAAAAPHLGFRSAERI